MNQTKLSVSNLDLYYGNFHALKNIIWSCRKRKYGIHRALLARQIHSAQSLNRMNDLIEGCRITGQVLLDGEDIYKGMDVNLLRRRVGMVFQKPNPFPMSIYDNIAYGPRTHGIRSKVKLDEIVEKALRDAAIWDEVKDRLKKNCSRHERRAAAAALHCQSLGGAAGGASDG